MATEIGAIGTESAQVPALLERAGQAVTAAGEQTGRTATQAAATGMAGVGRRMLAVREQIKTVSRALAGAAGTGDQVLTAVRAAADPAGAAEVVEHLRVAGERLDALREQLVAVAGQLASIKQRITTTITAAEQLGAAGSPPGKVAPEVARAEPGDSALGGRSPGRPRRSGSGGMPDPGHFDAVVAGCERVGRADLPEEWMRARSQDFRPRAAGTIRATAGAYRYRDDPGSDPTAVSSDPRDPRVNQDLDYSRLTDAQGRPLRGIPRNARHAEMRAAARMRQDERSRLAAAAQLAARGETPPARQPRHLDVVIDNSVCGSRDFDQRDWLTCDRLLPGAIPAGDTMTVWGSVDGGQSLFRKTFTGTGSLIR